MTRFSLFFVQQQAKQYYIFPLPKSNIYQKIQQLEIPQSGKIINLDEQQQLLIADAQQNFHLNFHYQAKACQQDWSKVKLKKTDSKHFSQDQYLNYLDPQMQALASDWIAGEKDLKKITVLLYEQTLQYLNYGQPIKGLYPYSQALKEKTTDCGGFATFLITLLQTQGLFARLAVGYLLKNNYQQKIKNVLNLTHHWSDLEMHAWLELLTADGQYLALDPAVDWRYRHGMSRRFATFTNLPADRLLISYGHNHQLQYFNKQHHWPILQHPELIKDDHV